MIFQDVQIHYDINEDKSFGNKDQFIDEGILDSVINWYCEKTEYDARKVVSAVFEAIEEYENATGDDFVLDKKVGVNYMKLYFFLVREFINEEYYEKFEEMSETKQCKSDTEEDNETTDKNTDDDSK